ncbi:hypothetical protein GWK47_028255 [Chionoecetes opilio]|uniref:Uncharacterized protein n=1 Tax=Chionoecetes opilio TaxID=41210 RepID=A0A8J5CS44_CHIOP|nr:hypothetical protein GWK47_028255 [Chionoecetes opilio]
MLISRRQRPPDTPIPTILLGGRPVPLQTSFSILGVEVNSVLTFTDHIRTIARKAVRKLSCVRRVSHLLDSQGITTLYAAQVRSLMEYAPLTSASRRSRSVRRLQDTQAECPAPGCSLTALGKTTRPHHTNCCYQSQSTDHPFCQDGDLSAFLPSTLHKNVEPHGTADTASLYLVTPDLQECCERLDKAAIPSTSHIGCCAPISCRFGRHTELRRTKLSGESFIVLLQTIGTCRPTFINSISRLLKTW